MIPAIIETHLHLWKVGRVRYPWMEDPTLGGPLRSDYLVNDLLRDSQDLQIRGTVHVQAEMDHALDPVIETSWLAGLAAERPDDPVPGACIGYADLRAGDLSRLLDRHGEYPIFRGIRQEVWCDPKSTRADILRENLLDNPRWSTGLDLLGARGLLFELLAFRHQLPQATQIFAARPEVAVVLEHFALPEPAEEALAEWRTNLRSFAEQVPQAQLKISGLSFFALDWTVEQVKPLLHEALETFGIERCFFGGNWPIDSLAGTYADLWHKYDEMTADLSPSEREALFSANAAKVYGLQPG